MGEKVKDIQDCIAATQRLSDRLDSHIADMQYQIRQLEPASMKETIQRFDKLEARDEKIEIDVIKTNARVDAIIGSNLINTDDMIHTTKDLQDLYVKSSVGLKELEPIVNAGASWISRMINEEVGDVQTRHKLYLYLKEQIIYKERANVKAR